MIFCILAREQLNPAVSSCTRPLPSQLHHTQTKHTVTAFCSFSAHIGQVKSTTVQLRTYLRAIRSRPNGDGLHDRAFDDLKVIIGCAVRLGMGAFVAVYADAQVIFFLGNEVPADFFAHVEVEAVAGAV